MEYLLSENELLKFSDRIALQPWFGFDHDRKQIYPLAESLEDYVLRRGWTPDQLESMKNDPCSLGMTGLAMLQSMLFFGIWESITSNTIASKDFIVDVTGDLKLWCSKLRLIMQQHTSKALFYHEASRIDTEAIRSKASQICRVFEAVASWDVVLIANPPAEFASAIGMLRRQTALAVDVLGFLYYQLSSYLKKEVKIFHHLGLNRGFYEQLLRDSQLCPSYYEYLDYLGVSVLEYFCVTSHLLDYAQSSHTSCSSRVCIASSTVSSQKAHHLQTECICSAMSIPTTRIREVLLSNQYFVIDIVRLLDRKASPQDAVVPYHYGLKYVAFSHV